MRKLLLALVLCALPATAIAQTYPQTNSNVQGQQPTNSGLTNTNPVVIGCQGVSTASAPTASSNRNSANEYCDITGAQYVRIGSGQPFHCALNALGTTLTQCNAVITNPYRFAITDVTAISTTSTGAGFALETGTGTNCGTGTTYVYPWISAIGSWPVPANTALPEQFHFSSPIITSAAVELCGIGTSATNTIALDVFGYLVP